MSRPLVHFLPSAEFELKRVAVWIGEVLVFLEHLIARRLVGWNEIPSLGNGVTDLLDNLRMLGVPVGQLVPDEDLAAVGRRASPPP